MRVSNGKQYFIKINVLNSKQYKINNREMRTRNLLLLIILLMFGLNGISAQITAPSSISSEFAVYDGITSSDPIFFFNNKPVNLTCNLTGATDYTWYKYDNQNWNNAGLGSSLSISNAGLYRVDVSGGDFSGTHYCWAFWAELYEIEASVANSGCGFLDLTVKSDFLVLNYFNPNNTSETGTVDYKRTFTWTASTEEPEPFVNPNLQAVSLKEPPYETTIYTVKVEDKFGNSRSDEIEYEAIAVKAAFEYEIMKADVRNEVKGEPIIEEASAPLEMRFTDESKGNNITSRFWEFGNSGFSNEKNPFFVFTEVIEEGYAVTLEVKNEGCTDKSDGLLVKVIELLLEVPNVFTPNGDGANDEFRVVYRSVKKYKITIVNRWGKIVYQSTDPAKGWDGNVGGSTAPPGVYFYYIEAEGYNKNERRKKDGSVHLIREKR